MTPIAGPGSSPLAFRPEEQDLRLEVLQRLERPVDRREPQVGDLVELAQRAEYRQAHLVGRELRAAAGPDRVLDALREDGQLPLGDRSALAGLADAVDHFVPAEGLGRAAAFDDHHRRALHRGEAAPALRAAASAADRRA